MTPILVAAAVTTASVALATDVTTRRIPNWLCGGAFVIGVLANLWLNGWQGGLSALAGAGLGLLILLPFFLLRAMGAGDVKLLAALGAILGPQLLVSVAVYGGLVGGLMSLVILAHRGTLVSMVSEILILHAAPTPSGAKAPYGVAIAAGVLLALLLPPVLG